MIVCVIFLTVGIVNVISGLCGIMGLLCKQRWLQKLLLFSLILNILMILIVAVMQYYYAKCSTKVPRKCRELRLDIIFIDDEMNHDSSAKLDRINQALMAIEVAIVTISTAVILSLLAGWKLDDANRERHGVFSSTNYYQGYIHTDNHGRNITSEFE